VKKQKVIMRCKLLLAVTLLSAVYSVSADSLENLLFTVRRDDRECGSAFLASEAGRVWMMSNYHVVKGDAAIEFIGMTDRSRVYSLPEKFEVSKDRDAIRFQLEETNGFTVASGCEFDDEVLAFGNSGGAGVITKSKGTVVGRGRGQIEVTCEIIPGNSGGPVINARNEVVGIATFIIKASISGLSDEQLALLPDAERDRIIEKTKETKGTRYTDTRRFAVPVCDTQWQAVSLTVFKEESVRFEALDEKYDRFNEAIVNVFKARSMSTKNAELFSRSWVNNYNDELDEYGYYSSESGRFYIKSGRKESFYRAYGRWLRALSEVAERTSNEYAEESENLTISYFKQEISARADKLSRTSKELLTASEKYKP
jgi:hypothetical protein